MKKCIVIGAGTMGRGIAQYLATCGLQVQLVDLNIDLAKTSVNENFKSWDKLQTKGKFSAEQVDTFKKNLTPSEFNNIDLDSCLVIEAIIENLQIKSDLFCKLDKLMHENCIFASNTSSIPIGALGSKLPLKRKEKFLGIHFFNPAPVMKLIELIKSPFTEQKLINHMKTWFQDHGKIPVVSSDSPGFIVNRVARNFYGEPLRILGNHNPEKAKQIDNVLKEVGGFRMGPFELMDLIGIDVNYEVTQSVWKAFYNEPRFAPHKLQRTLVEANMLGRKTKRGIYEYE